MMINTESRAMRFQSSHIAQRDNLPAKPSVGVIGISGLLRATSMLMQLGSSGSEVCLQQSLVPSIQTIFSRWSSGGKVAMSSLLVRRPGGPSSGMSVSCLQKGHGSWSSTRFTGRAAVRRARHSKQKVCWQWRTLGVLKMLS